MEAVLKTKMGNFYIQFTSKGLSLLSFSIPRKSFVDDIENPFAKDVLRELEGYFSGELKQFSIKLDLAGTPFQKSVWKRLQKIPYGKTKSYGDISHELKLNKGARAVGGANNKNPIPIIIPCHRVIQSDGKLGGYAGGLALKKKFLKIEGTLLL